jgi:hypothetical protein
MSLPLSSGGLLFIVNKNIDGFFMYNEKNYFERLIGELADEQIHASEHEKFPSGSGGGFPSPVH